MKAELFESCGHCWASKFADILSATPLTGPDNPLLYHYFCYYLEYVYGNEMFTIGDTLRCTYEKCWAGRSTSWDQDCQDKYQYLRYADNTTITAESEEELKNLLVKVKEESEKAGLKLNIQKTKIMESGQTTS